MNRLFLTALLCSFSAVAWAIPSSLYYGPTSQEGVLAFSAFVELQAATAPSKEQAEAQIKKQYYYMLGNMQHGGESFPASPSRTYELTNVAINLKPGVNSTTYRIRYAMKMNIAFDKGHVTGEMKFVLPRDPSQMEGLTNRDCSRDKEHVIWYRFDPRQPGCTLVEGKDFDVITGQIFVKANTTESYPEYDKLVGSDGLIDMWVMINEEIFKSEGIISKLTAEGFERHTWSQTEITDYLGFAPDVFPQVDTFTLRGPSGKGLKVTIFFGNCNINKAGSKPFHFFYKYALERSSVVVYSGHSEYGRNIDLGGIEKLENFTINVKQDYQLYFLSGCITYGYYVDMYLARKATPEDPRGTKNLDVLDFGYPAPGYDDKPLFAVADALIAFAKSEARTSYQTLTNKINYSWMAVVGDEDNGNP